MKIWDAIKRFFTAEFSPDDDAVDAVVLSSPLNPSLTSLAVAQRAAQAKQQIPADQQTH